MGKDPVRNRIVVVLLTTLLRSGKNLDVCLRTARLGTTSAPKRAAPVSLVDG